MKKEALTLLWLALASAGALLLLVLAYLLTY